MLSAEDLKKLPNIARNSRKIPIKSSLCLLLLGQLGLKFER